MHNFFHSFASSAGIHPKLNLHRRFPSPRANCMLFSLLDRTLHSPAGKMQRPIKLLMKKICSKMRKAYLALLSSHNAYAQRVQQRDPR